MKASVIIQARMSSSRLPGKVMMEVKGKPLIGHMIDRLKHCKNVDQIIVATSHESANGILCEYLEKNDIDVFSGSENDVLSRYYEVAKKYNISNIVRLTADCPLIDPSVVDHFINEFFKLTADYIYPSPTLAEGLDTEVFKFHALEIAFHKAKKISEREHVTQYFHNNPGLFKMVKLNNKTDDSKYRITVDEKEDYEVVKRIFKALYQSEKEPFGIEQIKKFLDQNPEIFAMNASIIRNEGLQISLKTEKE